MAERQRSNGRTKHMPAAGGKVSRLFDSPYRIGTPEAAADFVHLGNGRGKLIDESIDDLIARATGKVISVEDALGPEEDALEPHED